MESTKLPAIPRVKRGIKGCDLNASLCNILVKVIVEYSDVEWALCSGNIRTKYCLHSIAEYTDMQVAPCHSDRKITCFMKDISEYINVEGATRHSSKRNKYLYILYFRIY
jgi:hypothetical protein